ncbi:TPR and ankyrin repeat-containing protein 1-like [Physella acuta]|uniref:TPR and ankyrin repeat-containing protein 1-like n=1 Tax=Physella acuta TaxID=109671 RepID=UPI0027DB08E3|nr:TPR and ankyrin repeat-containing protein 1-like [Physella acuta]
MTSKQLLLLLDDSADVHDGNTFFPRDEDGFLKTEVPGWEQQIDTHWVSMLLRPLLEGNKKTALNSNEGKRKQKQQECTYDVFSSSFWKRILQKVQINCHPSLVWIEIMSFIKGSQEALLTEKGFLNLEDYEAVGFKQAPNFTESRPLVYECYKHYEKLKKQLGMFDEMDVVFQIYKRMKKMESFPWTVDEIYVDEAQDFTVAELALMILLCKNVNKMFLTGDTAQNILKGISFRFVDLGTLFYQTKHSAEVEKKQLDCSVPLLHLKYNYRSHKGILALASAVLDLLEEFFPRSFDQLDRDQGMFDGPKPAIIESSSSEQLLLLLAGNNRETSHIEFGADQAILVVNDQAKDKLPHDLKHAIVLTIFESKGLEFDDVLLYNFFKDSAADSEWRAVTKYLNTLCEGEGDLNLDLLKHANRPHPLDFDPNQHKILSSELKQLYTALTRARANVWIFDEDDKKRAPMFEYFRVRKLVTDSSGSFAKASDITDWKKRGDEFMVKKEYILAAKCYKHANQEICEEKALTFAKFKELSNLLNPLDSKSEFIKTAISFVKLNEIKMAATCLKHVEEFSLSATLNEKNGDFQTAVEHYIRCGEVINAGRCLETMGKYNQAIDLLFARDYLDEALECLERYNTLIEQLQDKKIPKELLECKPQKNMRSKILFRKAKLCKDEGKLAEVRSIASMLPGTGERIDLFTQLEMWLDVALLQRELGNTREAAECMLLTGEYDSALQYAKEGFHKPLVAFIYMSLLRKFLQMQLTERKEENENRIQTFATAAKNVYCELGDSNGEAQVKFLVGCYAADPDIIKSAKSAFKKGQPINAAGLLECQLRECQNIGAHHATSKDCNAILQTVVQGKNVIGILLGKDKRDVFKMYLEFYGLTLNSKLDTVSYHPSEYSIYSRLNNDIENKENHFTITVNVTKAIGLLVQHILSWLETVVVNVRKVFKQAKNCWKWHGVKCCNPKCSEANCKLQHNIKCYRRNCYDNMENFNLLKCSVVLDGCLNEISSLLKSSSFNSEFKKLIPENSRWDQIQDFVQFLQCLHSRPKFDNEEMVEKILAEARKKNDFQDEVVKYIQYNQDQVDDWKRKKLTSLEKFAEANFCASLLKLQLSVKMEKSAKNKPDLQNLGLTFEELLQFWVEGKEEASTQCFIKIISNFSYIRIFGTRQLFYWLEIHLSSIWFNMTKNAAKTKDSELSLLKKDENQPDQSQLKTIETEEQNPCSLVFLPKSYHGKYLLAKACTMDATGGVAADESSLTQEFDKLVQFLTTMIRVPGKTKQNSSNEMEDTCCSTIFLKPKEAETYIIILAVVLINIPGKFVSIEFEKQIVESLRKIPEIKEDETNKKATEKQKGSKTNTGAEFKKPNTNSNVKESKAPEESKKLLNKLIVATQKENNYQAIASALNEYLRIKNEEMLQYKWNEDKSKLVFETMNLSMLPTA